VEWNFLEGNFLPVDPGAGLCTVFAIATKAMGTSAKRQKERQCWKQDQLRLTLFGRGATESLPLGTQVLFWHHKLLSGYFM
jgi:hypothetical protein